jgi:hypothetical protein
MERGGDESGRSIRGDQSLFFENALPEGVFKYSSKSTAFWRSEKAMAVLIRQGLSFEV